MPSERELRRLRDIEKRKATQAKVAIDPERVNQFERLFGMLEIARADIESGVCAYESDWLSSDVTPETQTYLRRNWEKAAGGPENLTAEENTFLSDLASEVRDDA